MEKKKVWVIGHRHPDTDSVCAAIAYANFKNQISEIRKENRNEYVPKRVGDLNPETVYVLNRFGFAPPEIETDAGTQLKDITIRRTEGVSSNITMKKAWEIMKELDVVTLPVVNSKKKLDGIIVIGDIAKSYMDVYDNTILSTARTPYKNIAETLNGKIITGNEHGYFYKGKVAVAAGSPEVVRNYLGKDDLVIAGDQEELQQICMEQNCSCLIVTSGMSVEQAIIKEADRKEVVIISTPFDTFTAARLINQSLPIRNFMTRERIISFEQDDYVNEVKDIMGKIRHRDFPVLDQNKNYVGMVSRRNLMTTQKKKLILVDHNEKSQAIMNVEEAEVLEIIDHHRLGSLETMTPVYFRNQPLGCTSTIVYQIYQENEVPIPKNIAGLLLSAILSDTLMFRSPTCTALDQQAGEQLAKIAEVSIEELAGNMFEAASDFKNKTEDEILNQDFKIFHNGSVSFGVAQVSAMSKMELEKLKERLSPRLHAMLGEKKIDLVYVMLTDILAESTFLLYSGDNADRIASSAFQLPASKEGMLLRGVVSRKKQIIPELMNAMNE